MLSNGACDVGGLDLPYEKLYRLAMQTVICERCGVKFDCGVGSDTCWCKSLPVANVEPGMFSECLCRSCLTNMNHPAKLRQDEDYYFNEDGLMVLTSNYLKRRGYCCENGCKHCPY